MRWATRAGCHVDRAACARLLRGFVDPDAQFVFVEDPADVPDDAMPFDMRGVELTHHGDDCTFETMLHHFDLNDPVLWDLSRLVHEADIADERFDEPGAPGLDAICRAVSLVAGEDGCSRSRLSSSMACTSSAAGGSSDTRTDDRRAKARLER